MDKRVPGEVRHHHHTTAADLHGRRVLTALDRLFAAASTARSACPAYARMDFRVTPHGQVYVLERTPTDLETGEDLPEVGARRRPAYERAASERLIDLGAQVSAPSGGPSYG